MNIKSFGELVGLTKKTFTGNAAIAGMTEDLKLEGNQLNVAVTVFYSTS